MREPHDKADAWSVPGAREIDNLGRDKNKGKVQDLDNPIKKEAKKMTATIVTRGKQQEKGRLPIPTDPRPQGNGQ